MIWKSMCPMWVFNFTIQIYNLHPLPPTTTRDRLGDRKRGDDGNWGGFRVSESRKLGIGYNMTA